MRAARSVSPVTRRVRFLSWLCRALALSVALALLVAIPASAGTGFTFVLKWGANGSGDGEFGGPFGAEVGPNGIYITDYPNDRVQVFSTEGAYAAKWGSTGTGNGEFSGPVDIAIANDGTIYVADHKNHRIQIFDQTRTYVGKWGRNGGDCTSGSGNGEFNYPIGIATGPDGCVYVADRDNNRIQKFDGDGIYLDQWGSTGTGNGEFDHPWDVAVSDDGRVYVSDHANERVQVFDTDGDYLFEWGSPGSLPGKFENPAGLDVDSHGNVAVTELWSGRVQVFTADGDLITYFGGFGSLDGQFNTLNDICLDGARNAYATDYGNHRVQKFAWEQPTEVAPVSGLNRFATAIAASKKGWPDGLDNGEGGLKTAIVATARNWPDALGGAGLAGAIDAPILLVEPDSLPGAVAAELGRLGAEQVYILGGAGAVGANVASAILALPGVVKIRRFGGSDRYATALLIAAEVTDRASYSGSAFVATGENFPDALAAAPIAAYNAWPIYLTPQDALPTSVRNAVAADTTSDSFVLGGPAAISEQAMDTVEAALPAIDVDRISGTDRYRTALAIANAFSYQGASWHLTWNRVALATGLNFPDALAGGPVQGRDRSFILLTSGTNLESAVADALGDHKDEIYEIRYLGGPAAIEPDVRSSAEALLW